MRLQRHVHRAVASDAHLPTEPERTVRLGSALRCSAEVIQQYTVARVDALDDTEYILNILAETFEADTITYTLKRAR